MSDVELYGLLCELGYDWLAEAAWKPGETEGADNTGAPAPRPRRRPPDNPDQPRLL